MKQAVIAAFIFAAAQGTLTTCPNDNLACRAEGEACGFVSASGTVALCGENLFCQSDEMVSPEEMTSKYIGTCTSACNTGYMQVDFGLCAPVCRVEDAQIPESSWFWANHEEYVVVDECNNQCKCDATTGQFDCPPAAPCKASIPGLECRDFRAWTDLGGKTCKWFEEDAMRCRAFGATRANDEGYTAEQACCVCGGGKDDSIEKDVFKAKKACDIVGTHVSEGTVLTTDTCGSTCECENKRGEGYVWTCTRGEQCPSESECENGMGTVAGEKVEWEDQFGNTCEWYAADPLRCLMDYAGLNSNQRATEACCACGRAKINMEPLNESGNGIWSNGAVIALSVVCGVLGIGLIVTSYMLWSVKNGSTQ